jgi:hypothetical protein
MALSRTIGRVAYRGDGPGAASSIDGSGETTNPQATVITVACGAGHWRIAQGVALWCAEAARPCMGQVAVSGLPGQSQCPERIVRTGTASRAATVSTAIASWPKSQDAASHRDRRLIRASTF